MDNPHFEFVRFFANVRWCERQLKSDDVNKIWKHVECSILVQCILRVNKKNIFFSSTEPPLTSLTSHHSSTYHSSACTGLHIILSSYNRQLLPQGTISTTAPLVSCYTVNSTGTTFFIRTFIGNQNAASLPIFFFNHPPECVGCILEHSTNEQLCDSHT